MPAHTVSSALILAHGLIPGAPWILDTWTVLKSNPAPHGLFETDSGPLHPPLRMTESERTAVLAYFEAFLAKDEQERYKFAIGRPIDNFDNGRRKWKDWSRAMWTAMRWPDRIDKFLEEEGYHPNQLYRATGPASMSIDSYAPIWDKVADMIFGDAAFVETRGARILHPDWRMIVKIILNAMIQRHSAQLKRNKITLEDISAQADTVMEGASDANFASATFIPELQLSTLQDGRRCAKTP
jgi:hypothetical protein